MAGTLPYHQSARRDAHIRKAEIPYSEGILKSIGSSEGMQPYNGEVGIYGKNIQLGRSYQQKCGRNSTSLTNKRAVLPWHVS
jgi:hypothetical protein